MLDRDPGIYQSVSERIRRQEEFPEDPEKRFEAVFAAIGNSEAKCVAFLCLTESPVSAWEFHNKFSQACNKAWKTNGRLQATWTEKSLVPIGMVAEVETMSLHQKDYIVGYRLTEAGKKFQPVAAFALAQSLKFDNSLGEMFGPTSKGAGATRAVVNRARILEFLASQNRGVRELDVVQSLDLDKGVVGQSLRHLSKINLVKYLYADSETSGQFLYEVRNPYDARGATRVRSYKTLTDIVAILVANHDVGTEISIDYALAEVKKMYTGSATDKALRSRVSLILSDFVAQGFLNRGKFRGGSIMSEASITDSGRAVVEQIIVPVRAALAGDADLLNEFRTIEWQKFAAAGVSRHKEVSKNANSRPVDELIKEAYAYLISNPGARPREMRSDLGKSVVHVLRILIDSGRVKKVKKGPASCYYAVESKDPFETPGPTS